MLGFRFPDLLGTRFARHPVPASSDFPPSYDDSPIAYLLGLIGDVGATVICLMVILYLGTEFRRLRAAERRVCFSHGAAEHHFGLVRASNRIILGFAGAMLVRTLPDTLWMLAWGELSAPTMTILFQLDYALDFFGLLILGPTMALWIRTRQSIPQQLMQAARSTVQKMNRESALEILRVAGLVIGSCALVTVAKALA